jgi:hypothetical protein
MHDAGCALITGASTGIGREMARVFARHGHNLVLVARSEEKLRHLAEQLSAAHGVSARLLAKDLARPGGVPEILAALRETSTQIDYLVNNAGVDVYGQFAETDWQQEAEMIQLNLVSLTHLTKLLLPEMRRRGFGRILNLGSTGSFAPTPLNAVYSATKAYVWSLSFALAEELRGSGVTVTVLCPGVTRTEFQARAHIQDVRLMRLGVMDAGPVAEAGYRAMMAGRPSHVPGLYNQAQALAGRLLPTRLLARLARIMLEPLS